MKRLFAPIVLATFMLAACGGEKPGSSAASAPGEIQWREPPAEQSATVAGDGVVAIAPSSRTLAEWAQKRPGVTALLPRDDHD